MARGDDVRVTTTSSSTVSSASSSSAASLSFITATTPTRRAKVNESWMASRRARAPAGLCAASTSTVGLRRTISSRPGESTRRQPGPQHVDVERLLATAEERLDRRDRHRGVLRLVRAVQRQEEVGVLGGQAAQRDLLPTHGHVTRR